MIVKTISHSKNSEKAISQLINYICAPAKMNNDVLGRKPLISKRLISGYDQKNWAHQFYDNHKRRTYQHAKATVVRHEIISFSPESNRQLTREALKDLAQYYLQNRSPQSLGVAAVHYDLTPHIHFIISGVGIDSKSTRITQKQFKEFKIQYQNYQQEKYPELSASLVNHSKKKA